ncbi:MAG: hypothetical protein IPM32_02730 [Ignavibacteriae bacterium]|nr:hypothetical protein [Ignavibacteriota bacterium]
MFGKVKSKFLLLIVFTSQIIFPQENLNSLSTQDDFNFGSWFSGSKNFIEVSYGFGELKHKEFTTDFNPISISEIKLGRRYLKPAGNYRILEFEDNFLFSTYLNYNQTQKQNLEINTNIWRFGIGYRKGYGYSLGTNFEILPSYSLAFVWNQSKFNHPSERILTNTQITIWEEENKILKKYDNEIKFGNTNSAGIDIRISSMLNIGVNYETQILFPQYLVWKHLGSFGIELLSQTGIDFLTQGVIIKAVPKLTPILNFLMKNGLSYFFYTLKQEKMFWPFDTKAPLAMETLKFDLKITF